MGGLAAAELQGDAGDLGGTARMYAYIQGGVSAQPVPEPETYAMLLAGLGLIGTVVKRRKVKQA